MPKSVNISLMINSICRKFGIKYESTNPYYVTLIEDAQRLGQIFLNLKIIADDLEEIEKRYNLNGISKLFDDDINTLRTIDHDLIKIMNEIHEKVKKEKKNE